MNTEPAVIAAAVAAILNAAVLIFTGDDLEPEVQAAIVTVVTVLAGLFIRSKVTPTERNLK